MKKPLLITLSLFLIFSINASAQTDWEWDTHGIGFTTPAGFKVTVNNAEEFSAESDNVFITLSAWQDENINESDLADALVASAVEMGYDNVNDVEQIDYNDFLGYAAFGDKDGMNVVIGMLLDKESSTNLMVIVIFNPGNENTAERIVKSIYAYDE